MWIQARFPPGEFWSQTPRHFQLAMEGVRKRLKQEGDARLRDSWNTGAFAGVAYHGKLKDLAHYQPKQLTYQAPAQMLDLLRSLGANTDMKITQIKLGERQ